MWTRRTALQAAALAGGSALLAACGGSTTAVTTASSVVAAGTAAVSASAATTTVPVSTAAKSASTSPATATSSPAATSAATSSSAAVSTSAATSTTAAPAGSSSAVTVAPAASAQKGQVTIQYWTWDQTALKAEEASFLPQFAQEHPDIKVTPTFVVWETNGYFDKLQTMGISAQAPDVYWQSVAYAWDFANNGLTLNLQPYVNRSLKLTD